MRRRESVKNGVKIRPVLADFWPDDYGGRHDHGASGFGQKLEFFGCSFLLPVQLQRGTQ